MDKWFQAIGVVTTISMGVLLVVGIFGMVVGIPIEAGRWAMDRFGTREKEETVVLRQDARAKPIWICADGTAKAPRNCLSREELLTVLRARR